jgi:hypothetical protein
MEIMFNCTSLVNIPAYDASNNGLIIEFKLTATSSDTYVFSTKFSDDAILKELSLKTIKVRSPRKFCEDLNVLI